MSRNAATPPAIPPTAPASAARTSTSRRRKPNESGAEPGGLGLGFFIAKTLLERSGATLTFENRSFPERGAIITVRWRRPDFERPLTFTTA